MYFGYKAVPSFLAKYEISKYPLFGVTARGMQSIFVQRSKTDDKETTRYEIEQRVKAIQEGKNLP
jgi:1-acyl-sn-glycerol-3-phosphate acyltransferase